MRWQNVHANSICKKVLKMLQKYSENIRMTHDGRRFKLRLSRTKRKVDRRRQILAFLGASCSVEISTSIDDYKRLSLAARAAVAAAAGSSRRRRCAERSQPPPAEAHLRLISHCRQFHLNIFLSSCRPTANENDPAARHKSHRVLCRRSRIH